MADANNILRKIWLIYHVMTPIGVQEKESIMSVGCWSKNLSLGNDVASFRRVSWCQTVPWDRSFDQYLTLM